MEPIERSLFGQLVLLKTKKATISVGLANGAKFDGKLQEVFADAIEVGAQHGKPSTLIAMAHIATVTEVAGS